MPIYTFKCNDCQNIFEIIASYKEYNNINIKCDKCNSIDTDRAYSEDLQNITGSVIKSDCDLKLGHLANRNRDRMSDDHKQHLYNKHNSYKGSNVDLPNGMSRIPKGPKTKWT